MRIAHVTTVSLTLAFLKGQFQFMQERGFEVHAVSSPGPLLDELESSAGIRIHAVEMPRSITPFRDARVILRLNQILRKNHPEIVHAHTPKGGLLGMVSGFLMRTPVRIYQLHGMPYTSATGPRRVLLKMTEKYPVRSHNESFA